MWRCFAFDLEDDAVRLFWIKILQENVSMYGLAYFQFLIVVNSLRWTLLGSEKRVCLKEMPVFKRIL